MLRRDVVKLGAVLSLLGSRPLTKAVAQARPEITPFDDSTVKLLAQKLAKTAFNPPPQTLPKALDKLTFDQFRGIAFKQERALWHGQGLAFDVEFFPRGFLYRPRILMNEVVDGHATPIAYDPDMFSYQDTTLRVDGDIGFAGLRLRNAINTPNVMEEFAVFLGASYFRAVAKGQCYGLSARGFANGTGDPKGEEFAIFREFWIEKPRPGIDSIVIHALLDSHSVVGAFRFSIRPGITMLFDVQTSFFPRKDISESGIAALTGMFYFDANCRDNVDDWRNAAHDSEALQIWTGAGAQLYRPLKNPAELQFSAFSDSSPHGFGLMQRRRNFSDFNDLALNYEKRPSLWIEPIGDWGDGAVDLVEIPIRNEVNDNIVSFWRPKNPLKQGREYAFTYRMYWGWDTPWKTSLARIGATRVGSITDHADGRMFVIDFTGKPFENLPPQAAFHLIAQASAGTIKNVVVEPNPNIKGWRTMFEFYPGEAKLSELQCQLADEHGPISERWVYRWTP